MVDYYTKFRFVDSETGEIVFESKPFHLDFSAGIYSYSFKNKVIVFLKSFFRGLSQGRLLVFEMICYNVPVVSSNNFF